MQNLFGILQGTFEKNASFLLEKNSLVDAAYKMCMLNDLYASKHLFEFSTNLFLFFVTVSN